MPNYPLVFLPAPLESALRSNPPPPRRPQPPNPPEPLRASPYTIVVPVILFGVAAFFNALLDYRFFGGIGMLLMLAAVPLGAYVGLYKPQQRLLDARYREQMAAFKLKKKAFQQQLAAYETFVGKAPTAAAKREHRRAQILAQLAATEKPTKLKRAVQIGRSEEHFANYLQARFGKQIRTGLQLGKFEKPYAPDFCLTHESGLHIDIEIDEPYVATTGEPIHYRGADDARNQFFVNSGWVVVRFAEEQIVKYPEACCTFIEQVQRYALAEGEFPKNVVPPCAHWTKSEALKMAKSGKRGYF